MENFVIISGCSGGGKSTVLEELRRRGHAVVEEPGRRIVREEMLHGGNALPWVDETRFAQRAFDLALSDRQHAEQFAGWVFFDRSIIDAATFLDQRTDAAVLAPLRHANRYHSRVFMAPPWPELFANDEERRHSFENSVAEYEALCEAYSTLGYELLHLPQLSVTERADWIEQCLTSPPCRARP